MNFGKYLSLSRRVREPNGVKAERTHYSVTHNPSTAHSKETLLVRIPKLEQNILIVPGSMKLVFDIEITGDNDSWFVNNLAANLIKKVEIIWGAKTLLSIDNFDVLKTYTDLWLTTNQRNNLIRRGIQSTNLSKLRSKATSGSANETDSQLSRIFGNRYEIPLDFTFLTDQHPFYPYIYRESIQIDLYLQEPQCVINSGKADAKTNYKMSNIAFEYDTINEYSPQLANQIVQLSDSGGITYFYDYITFTGIQQIKQSDLIFTLNFTYPRRSARGILLLFTLPPETTNRDSENYCNPEITNVEINISGIPSKVFAQGLKEDRMWSEARKLFMNENQKLSDQSNITLSKFYGSATNSSYCFWIDLRSTEDNALHGNGTKIGGESSVTLSIKKNNTGSGIINVYPYLIADAQFTLINRYATDPQY